MKPRPDSRGQHGPLPRRFRPLLDYWEARRQGVTFDPEREADLIQLEAEYQEWLAGGH